MFDFISPYLSFIITISAVIGILFPIFKWVLDVNANIKKILHELTCNHGSSLKDKIIKLETEYESRKQLINFIYSTQRWILSVSDKMFFECDASGNWLWVNESLEDKLNLARNYLLNSGWKNYIVPEERTLISQEWEHGIKENKNINLRCKFEVNADTDEKTYVDLIISCEKINDGQWVGVVKEFNSTLFDRNITTKY